MLVQTVTKRNGSKSEYVEYHVCDKCRGEWRESFSRPLARADVTRKFQSHKGADLCLKCQGGAVVGGQLALPMPP